MSAEVQERVVRNSKTHVTTRFYLPKVQYEYQVTGASYQSSRVAFGELRRTLREDAQSVLDGIVKGDGVRVFYDPQNPKEAVLLNAEAPGSTQRVVVGALVVLASSLLLVYFLTQS